MFIALDDDNDDDDDDKLSCVSIDYIVKGFCFERTNILCEASLILYSLLFADIKKVSHYLKYGMFEQWLFCVS